MEAYWTNFAKYGHPNGEGVPEWPAFTRENPMVMHLGPVVAPGTVPDEAALKVLDAYFAWRRTPEGAAWVTSPESKP